MSEASVPANKFDLAAIERAGSVGFPTLNPHIPALLEWLQDPNWPVSGPIADLLSHAGPALIEPLRAVLASDDADWKNAVLTHLCPRLSLEILAEIERR